VERGKSKEQTEGPTSNHHHHHKNMHIRGESITKRFHMENKARDIEERDEFFGPCREALEVLNE